MSRRERVRSTYDCAQRRARVGERISRPSISSSTTRFPSLAARNNSSSMQLRMVRTSSRTGSGGRRVPVIHAATESGCVRPSVRTASLHRSRRRRNARRESKVSHVSRGSRPIWSRIAAGSAPAGRGSSAAPLGCRDGRNSDSRENGGSAKWLDDVGGWAKQGPPSSASGGAERTAVGTVAPRAATRSTARTETGDVTAAGTCRMSTGRRREIANVLSRE